MSVHLGLMIWKEMKRQKLSNSALALSLGVSKNRVQTILNESSIDTDVLVRICEVMRFNFFQLFEENEIFKKIEKQSQQETTAEIERLKALVIEKNRVIDLKDQLLKTQTGMITLLEKGQYQ